jgi:HEAT repeat protein
MAQGADPVTALIADLCGDDEFRRTQASFGLGVLGDVAVEPLCRLLAAPTSEIRKRAAWVLGVIGAPAIPQLLELAEHDDPHLRIEAIRVLGIVGEGRTLNRLLIGLTDANTQIAARSARALGKIGDPRAYHALMTALHHPHPDVRYEACRALVDLQILDALELLGELAANDTGRTSWGGGVADAARRAAEELQSMTHTSGSTDQFDQVRLVLDREQNQQDA